MSILYAFHNDNIVIYFFLCLALGIGLKGYSTQKLLLLQTYLSFFLLLNTNEDILKNELNFGTIDFHSIFFFYYGSQWCQTTVWFQSFFKISSFVFSRIKKLIQVCNNLRVSK